MSSFRWMLGAVAENTPLNPLSSRSSASVICSRLFAGSQGLRGGDQQQIVSASAYFASEDWGNMRRRAEALGHSLLHCPLQEHSHGDVKSHLHRPTDDRQYFASMPVGDLRKLQDVMVARWQIRKM